MIAVFVVGVLVVVAVVVLRRAFPSPTEARLEGPSRFGEWSVDDEVADFDFGGVRDAA